MSATLEELQAELAAIGRERDSVYSRMTYYPMDASLERRYQALRQKYLAKRTEVDAAQAAKEKAARQKRL